MGQKYTVKWNQGIAGNDIWRVGEERELTTDQFYFMETTYPGCLVPVQPKKSVPPPSAAPDDEPDLRAQTPAEKRVVTNAPTRTARPTHTTRPKPSPKRK